jgi:hypothetical protein
MIYLNIQFWRLFAFITNKVIYRRLDKIQALELKKIRRYQEIPLLLCPKGKAAMVSHGSDGCF